MCESIGEIKLQSVASSMGPRAFCFLFAFPRYPRIKWLTLFFGLSQCGIYLPPLLNGAFEKYQSKGRDHFETGYGKL